MDSLDRIRRAVVRLALRGLDAASDDDCTRPRDPIPDPPGASNEQRICALDAYVTYLECWDNCQEQDCKCKGNCWNIYLQAWGMCYPAADGGTSGASS